MAATQLIHGVALIVVNNKEEILILQEYETKPFLGKYSGMFSIPMETSGPGESDDSTLTRLIQQEIPGLNFSLDDALNSFIGIYRIVPNVWVTLYAIKTRDLFLPQIKSSEVGNYQWLTPRTALSLWLRQGAWEMINDFLGGKKGVFCLNCQTPSQLPPTSDQNKQI